LLYMLFWMLLLGAHTQPEAFDLIAGFPSSSKPSTSG